MDPNQLIFVDEDPDLQEVNDLFVDYNPEDLEKLEAASLFDDHNPEALVEKSYQVSEMKTPQEKKRPNISPEFEDFVYAKIKTPEEIRNLSMTEYMQYAQELDREIRYRQSKGFTKGLASGVSFGFSEYIPGLEPEEDDLMRGFGELVGSAVNIESLYLTLGKPLVKLAMKSKYARDSLAAAARMTGFGLTGIAHEGGKKYAKTGEAPTGEEIAKWGAEWVLMDAAFQVVGASVSELLTKASKATGSTAKDMLNETIATLSKEKINPEINPEQYVKRTEEILNSKIPKEQQTTISSQGETLKPIDVSTQIENKTLELVDEVKGVNTSKKASIPTQELKATETISEKLDVPEKVKEQKLKENNVPFNKEEAASGAKEKIEGAFPSIEFGKVQTSKGTKSKVEGGKNLGEVDSYSVAVYVPEAKSSFVSSGETLEEAVQNVITDIEKSSGVKPINLEAKPKEQKLVLSPAKKEVKAPEKPNVKKTKSPVKKEAPATKKEKPKPKPKFVNIPAEDIGKSSSEILGQHVQTGKKDWQLKIPTTKSIKDLAETQLYNKYAPLKILGEGEASVFNKPRILAEQVKGFASKAQSNLKLAQYDAATGEAIGPSFEQIFLPKRIKELTGKKKLDRAEFDKFLAAKTTLERQKLGHDSGMPTAAAEAFVRENEAKFGPLAEDLYKFGKNQINNLVHEGILSREAADKMLQMHKSHAPLYRVMPEELNLYETTKAGLTGKTPSDGSPQAAGSGSLNVKNPIKSAKGSKKVISSPTESIVKNAFAFENSIMKNRVMKATGRGLEKNGYEVKQISGAKKNLEEFGFSGGDLEVFGEDLQEAANYLNPEQPRGKVRWYEDGNLFEVNAPKDILEAVEGLSPEQASFVMKWIGKLKNTFSLGTVLQPGTLIRLTGMDFIASTLQSKFPKYNGLMELPTRVLYEYPRMLLNILGKGNLYKDYMQSGAAQVSLQGLDRAMLESMTDTLTNATARKSTLLKDTLTFPLTIAKKTVKGLMKVSEVGSDIPRLLEFERSMEAALKRGATKQEAMAEAAFDAFEVSVPYGRRGASKSLHAFYQMFPFLNTIVNSGVSFAKALSPTNPNSQAVWAAGLSYLTIPTMYQYMKNRNDPRYQALPQEDKDRSVYVYQTDDPNEEPLKVRKLWQYGYLFQTLPEHMAEYLFQRDPDAFKGLAKSFEYEFSPLTMLSLSSIVTDGKFDPMKVFENSRVSLVPERQKRIDAELQSTSSTTETAKLLAKYAKISPIYIDHIVNSTGGGLGRDVLRLADEFFYQTGMAVDKRPEKQAADSIFFGTWFGRGPSKRNEYLNEYYKYLDKFDAMKATAKSLQSEGKDDEADKIMDGYHDLASKKRMVFAKYYKEIERIRNEHPDDLNGKEKRAELNKIYQEMTDLAKEYVEIIKEETR